VESKSPLEKKKKTGRKREGKVTKVKPTNAAVYPSKMLRQKGGGTSRFLWGPGRPCQTICQKGLFSRKNDLGQPLH